MNIEDPLIRLALPPRPVFPTKTHRLLSELRAPFAARVEYPQSLHTHLVLMLAFPHFKHRVQMIFQNVTPLDFFVS